MKFVFKLMALLCAVVMMGSCQKESKDKKPLKKETVVTIANFNEVLKNDFNPIKDTCGKAVFYESQIALTAPVSNEGIEIESVINVFQAANMSYQIIRKGEDKNIVKVNDYWLEDVAIDVDKIISLDSAITRLKESNIVKPNSKMVTLRNPLGPKVTNPGYVFGQRSTGYVKVDAITGEVSPIK